MNAERAYALLLGLYPRAFRETFGLEMQQTFRTAHQRAALEGRLLGFWARIVLDTVFSAINEHAQAKGVPLMKPMVRMSAICFVILALLGIVRGIWFVLGNLASPFTRQISDASPLLETTLLVLALIGLWLAFGLKKLLPLERWGFIVIGVVVVFNVLQWLTLTAISSTGYQLRFLPPPTDRFPWWFNVALTVYPIFQRIEIPLIWVGWCAILLTVLPRMVINGRLSWSKSPLENRIVFFMATWMILMNLIGPWLPGVSISGSFPPTGPRWEYLPSIMYGMPLYAGLIALGVVLWQKTVSPRSRPLATN